MSKNANVRGIEDKASPDTTNYIEYEINYIMPEPEYDLAGILYNIKKNDLENKFLEIERAKGFAAAFNELKRKVADTHSKERLKEKSGILQRITGTELYNIAYVDTKEYCDYAPIPCKTRDGVNLSFTLDSLYHLNERLIEYVINKNKKMLTGQDLHNIITQQLSWIVENVVKCYDHTSISEIKKQLHMRLRNPQNIQEMGLVYEVTDITIEELRPENIPFLLQSAKNLISNGDYAQAKTKLQAVETKEAHAYFALADIYESLTKGELPESVDFGAAFSEVGSDVSDLVAVANDSYSMLVGAKQKLERGDLEAAMTYYSRVADKMKKADFAVGRRDLLRKICKWQKAVGDIRRFSELEDILNLKGTDFQAPELNHAKNLWDSLVQVRDAHNDEQAYKLKEALEEYERSVSQTFLNIDKMHIEVLKKVVAGIKLFNEEKFEEAYYKLSDAAKYGAEHGTYIETLRNAFGIINSCTKDFLSCNFGESKTKLESARAKLMSFADIKKTEVVNIIEVLKLGVGLESCIEAGKLDAAKNELEKLKQNRHVSDSPSLSAFISESEDIMHEIKDALEAIRRNDFENAKEHFEKYMKVGFSKQGAKAVQYAMEANDASKDYEKRRAFLKEAAKFEPLKAYANSEIESLAKEKLEESRLKQEELKKKIAEAQESAALRDLDEKRETITKEIDRKRKELEKYQELTSNAEKDLKDIKEETRTKRVPQKPSVTPITIIPSNKIRASHTEPAQYVSTHLPPPSESETEIQPALPPQAPEQLPSPEVPAAIPESQNETYNEAVREGRKTALSWDTESALEHYAKALEIVPGDKYAEGMMHIISVAGKLKSTPLDLELRQYSMKIEEAKRLHKEGIAKAATGQPYKDIWERKKMMLRDAETHKSKADELKSSIDAELRQIPKDFIQDETAKILLNYIRQKGGLK